MKYLTENYGAYPKPDGAYSLYTLDAPADDDGDEIRGVFINTAGSADAAREWINRLQSAYDTPCVDVVGKSEEQLRAEMRLRDKREYDRKRRKRLAKDPEPDA